MSGTINNAPSSPAGGGLKNPLLLQMETALEARLTPENRAVYMRIVVAGLHVALEKGPDGFVGKLHDSADPIGDAAKGAAQLVLILRKEAKGEMPMEAGIPAAITLMLHGLDFVEAAKIVQIGKPELDRAIAQCANELFHRVGITGRMLENATDKVHQIVNDPDTMAKINLKAGITQHPNAAKLTPLPDMPAADATAP